MPAIQTEGISDVVDYLWTSWTTTLSILGPSPLQKSFQVAEVLDGVSSSEPQIWLLAMVILLTVWMFNIAANYVRLAVNEDIQNDNNLLTLFQILLYQGSPRMPNSASNRILLNAFLFYVMFFVFWTYAQMKECAAFSKAKIYKTLEDVIDDNKISPRLVNCMNLLTPLFETSEDPRLKELWSRVNTPPGKIYIDLSDDYTRYISQEIENLLKWKAVFIGESIFMRMLIANLCPLFIRDSVKLPLFEVEVNDGKYLALRLRKNLNPDMRNHLHCIISYLTQSGLYRKLCQDIHQKETDICVTNSFASVSENPMEYLVLDSLSTTIMIWLTGLVISLVCFLAELACVYVIRKKTL